MIEDLIELPVSRQTLFYQPIRKLETQFRSIDDRDRCLPCGSASWRYDKKRMEQEVDHRCEAIPFINERFLVLFSKKRREGK